MSSLEEQEKLCDRVAADLGEDFLGQAEDAFDDDTLGLMLQNYANVQDELEQPRPQHPAMDFAVHIDTPNETKGAGQSVRSQRGTRVSVDLSSMMKAQWEKSNTTAPPSHYVVDSIRLYGAQNPMDKPAVLSATLNHKDIGCHSHGKRVDHALSDTQETGLYIAHPHQSMHLGGEGREIYNSPIAGEKVNEASVLQHLPLLRGA